MPAGGFARRVWQLETVEEREVDMSSHVQAEEAGSAPKRGKLPCETPGCSERCSFAYSCHDKRVGRPRFMAWPLFALAVLLVIGISL